MARKLSPFIEDGVFLDGYLDAIGYQLRFSFRPMKYLERSKFFQATEKLAEMAQHQKTAETVAFHLNSWDLTDHKGEAVQISGDNVLNLQPLLLCRLFSVISGSSPSDEDPNAVDESESTPQEA